MHYYTPFITIILCLLFVSEACGSSHNKIHKAHKLNGKIASVSTQNRISEIAETNPITAARLVLNIPGLNSSSGTWFMHNEKGISDSDKQVPWASHVTYQNDPKIQGNFITGYKDFPRKFGKFNLVHMEIKRNKHGAAKMPTYVKHPKNKNGVTKGIVVFPSLVRDSWRFANIMGNTQEIAKHEANMDAGEDNVVIMSPVFLTPEDGKIAKDDLRFNRQGWSVAGVNRAPKHIKGISSFDAVDHLVSRLLDRKEYPNLRDLVVVGFSMGGQAALRYSMFKKVNDERMRFWIGSPGKYTYLSTRRPTDTSDCKDYDKWPFGINAHHTLPKYVRSSLKSKGREGLISDFRGLEVHYYFGMNDNGGQSKECTHNVQGRNRLQRGAYWIIGLSQHEGGFPASHKTSYIDGTAHDPYPVIANPASYKYIFRE